jgi:hypothetical protein
VEKTRQNERLEPGSDSIRTDQAFLLGFSDTFYTLGVALIIALLAGLLLKKPDRLDAGGAH